MKRTMLVFLMLALLCCAPAALANSWGLKGELLDLVSDTDAWNDYTTLCDQAGDMAIMRSRYHHVLMIAGEDGLETYTKAVFQPESSAVVGRPELTAGEDGFTIRYHDGLWFHFRRQEDGCRLHCAWSGQISLRESESEHFYLATDEYGSSAVLRGPVGLEDFNIELFPRTINEVRHLELMRSWLDSETALSHPLNAQVSGAGKGTAPVYSAPFGKSAWRAAKGKAAVGLGGEVTKLFPLRNADGGEYWCIRYDVSQRTQRMGFVERARLDGEAAEPWQETDDLLALPLTVIQETYLTDDPEVSQYAQFTLPAGTLLTCMGLYDEDYAYVSAEVKDGRVTDGGQIVWGCVPLRDVQPLHFQVRPETEMMAQLEGAWWFFAGGLSVGDVLMLHADGTYESWLGTWDGELRDGELSSRGRWQVIASDPAYGLYWNDPAYEILFFPDDGLVAMRVEGLTVDGDSFHLTNWEGGGGYERVK